MKIGRNDPCTCGSGLKYKQCCENKLDRKQRTGLYLGLALVALVVGGLAMAAFMEPPDMSEVEPPVGKVWSKEHGHFHDITPGALRPPGEAPPGKVWNEEHGHWHNIDGSESEAAPPPGDPPPGKVWNEEHGHYHDAP